MSASKVRVLSFGAGVQSSALLLMADRGDIPTFDFAVFADTQAEPAEVSEWLAKMTKAVKIPIVVATRGHIARDTVRHWKGLLKRVGQPPLFTLDSDGNKGMHRRHSTKEYKIEVVDKAIRKRLKYRPYQRMKHKIEIVMGISYDEQERMRISMVPWKTNSYPLVDAKLTRQDCIKYVERCGVGTPPRSACFFCPYKTDEEWRRLKESPKDWAKAVRFDRKIRKSNSPQLSSQFFVHRSRKPLDQADISKDERQISMLDECDGMCGT